MILISDAGKNSIKVHFPTDTSRNIKGKTIYYTITDKGLLFSDGIMSKEIACPPYYPRILIYFDLLIKKREYEYPLEKILYKGKSILDSKFPDMGLELTEENHKKEQYLIDGIKKGIVLKSPANEEFELLLDLYLSKGIK